MHWWPWPSRDGKRTVDETDFVVFDLETGGLTPARDDILSLGGVRMRGARIAVGCAFYALVRPETGRLSAQSVRVHHLTPAQLVGQPPITQALPQFLDFCGGAVLAGWHVGLDLAFLQAWTRRLGLPQATPRSLDVLGLFLSLRNRGASPVLEELPLKDLTLYTVARALGISPRSAHDALGDAYLTAQVLQRLLNTLRQGRQDGLLSLATVLRLGAPGGALTPHPTF